MSKSKALTLHQQMPVAVMADLTQAGQLIAQAGILGASNPAEGFIIATTCHQEGMSLLKFGETYHVFNGKISMRSDAMLARFNDLGGTHRVMSRTADRASIEMTYDGHTEAFTLTWKEAQQEPFVYKGGPKAQLAELKKSLEKRIFKDKYATPRSRMQMLWARVVSDAVRCTCPQANQGSYAPEEVEDFSNDSRGNVTTSEPVPIDAADVGARVHDVLNADVSYPSTDVDDPNVCPMGGEGYEGRKWEAMVDSVLEMALESNDEKMTGAHANVVKGILTQRKHEKGESA